MTSNQPHIPTNTQLNLKKTGLITINHCTFTRQSKNKDIKDFHFNSGPININEGEWVLLLGPNGSGKSTLISAIAGFIPVDQTTITFDNNPLSKLSRRSIGFVFQNPALDAELSGMENLIYAGKSFGIPVTTLEPRIQKYLKLLDKDLSSSPTMDWIGRPVKTYSGGMKRKLDIVRALLHDPKVLILDEPTSGLDPLARQALFQLLKTLQHEKNLTLLMSSHRGDEASFSDKMYFFHHGAQVVSGNYHDLLSETKEDRLVLEGPELHLYKEKFEKTFKKPVHINSAGALELKCINGHQMLPQIFDCFPGLKFESITLRKPSIEDLFNQYTGATLHT